MHVFFGGEYSLAKRFRHKPKKSFNHGGKEKLDVDTIPEFIQSVIVFNIVPYLLIIEDPMKSSV